MRNTKRRSTASACFSQIRLAPLHFSVMPFITKYYLRDAQVSFKAPDYSRVVVLGARQEQDSGCIHTWSRLALKCSRKIPIPPQAPQASSSRSRQESPNLLILPPIRDIWPVWSRPLIDYQSSHPHAFRSLCSLCATIL